MGLSTFTDPGMQYLGYVKNPIYDEPVLTVNPDIRAQRSRTNDGKNMRTVNDINRCKISPFSENVN